MRFLIVLLLLCGCRNGEVPPAPVAERSEERIRMVKLQIEERDITDQRLLEALRKVPRHRFIPESGRASAYADHPVPIGMGQTISQPYIVAFMTEALALESSDKVLEIGTGSGYQAAVLGELVREVYTMEIVESLGRRAKQVLDELGYDNIHVRIGDGYRGWPEQAPFDAVMVTAAPDHIPQPLINQLKNGGRLIIPVGSYYQVLRLVRKSSEGLTEESILPVRFVPMTGEAEER